MSVENLNLTLSFGVIDIFLPYNARSNYRIIKERNLNRLIQKVNLFYEPFRGALLYKILFFFCNIMK